MRILYLSGSYVPSRRADSIQVVATCAAFVRRGHSVRLVCKRTPARLEPGVDDVFAFYGVEDRFELLPLARPAWRGGGLVFAWAMRRLLARPPAPDLVYCRDPLGAHAAARRGLPFVFEAHVPPFGRVAARRLRRALAAPSCRRLIVISRALESHYRERGHAPAGLQVIVAPDAAEAVAAGSSTPSRPAGARPAIGYVGHLYPGKGIERVLELAQAVAEADFHLLGGEEDALAALRSRELPSNVRLHGFVPPAQLPVRYRALDVTLLPYDRSVRGASGRSELGAWMSPMKLFEAMAAGKAILASDLPVLREVLEDGRNALLVPPEDLEGWVAALRRLLTDPDLRDRLGATARADHARSYTWDARARRVLDGLE